MEKYIGVKIIHAEPAWQTKLIEDSEVATIVVKSEYSPGLAGLGRDTQNGYKVVYEDGYTSWSPKDVFDKAYRKIGSPENTITQQNVDDFIIKVESVQMGDKTTVVKATLANGFIIVESSSCVDVKNFDMKIGTEICLEKIKDKIWFLLGFLLQCGVKGLND